MVLSFLVGVFEFLLGVLRLGLVVNFLSHPVVNGFTNAAAIIIALSQLDKLLGVPARRSGSFIADVWGLLSQAGDTRLLTLLMGIAAFVIMLAPGANTHRDGLAC